jgi:hypothetical protein
MSTETRWPEFARRAFAAGVGSMLTFRLYVVGDDLGALNLYAYEPGAFDSEAEHIGELFAAHAAIALAGAHRQEQLILALATRDLIGQAMGILMERYKVMGHQAFALLVQLSQDTNRKLRDVAAQLVQTGTWPPRQSQ